MTFPWKTALKLANNAKRCGAKTRQKSSCKAPAMKNGRCRFHGGKSPGAPYGEKHGRYTHGLYTSEIKSRRHYVHDLIKATRAIMEKAGC